MPSMNVRQHKMDGLELEAGSSAPRAVSGVRSGLDKTAKMCSALFVFQEQA